VSEYFNLYEGSALTNSFRRTFTSLDMFFGPYMVHFLIVIIDKPLYPFLGPKPLDIIIPLTIFVGNGTANAATTDLSPSVVYFLAKV
jgi:hypothetical protein